MSIGDFIELDTGVDAGSFSDNQKSRVQETEVTLPIWAMFISERNPALHKKKKSFSWFSTAQLNFST